MEVVVDGRLVRCNMHDGPNGPLYSIHVMPADHASSHDNEHDEAQVNSARIARLAADVLAKLNAGQQTRACEILTRTI